jgi:hypothetical protein
MGGTGGLPASVNDYFEKPRTDKPPVPPGIAQFVIFQQADKSDHHSFSFSR